MRVKYQCRERKNENRERARRREGGGSEESQRKRQKTADREGGGGGRVRRKLMNALGLKRNIFFCPMPSGFSIGASLKTRRSKKIDFCTLRENKGRTVRYVSVVHRRYGTAPFIGNFKRRIRSKFVFGLPDC